MVKSAGKIVNTDNRLISITISFTKKDSDQVEKQKRVRERERGKGHVDRPDQTQDTINRGSAALETRVCVCIARLECVFVCVKMEAHQCLAHTQLWPASQS